MVEVPDNIISSYSSGYEYYRILREQHLRRIELYAAIEGMIAGNPPMDQGELEANGLGHLANFNNFKARAYYERSGQMYWNLVNATEVFVKVFLSGDYPRITEYARMIARHFNDVVREWGDFYINMGLLGAQLSKFGICPVVWCDERSWMWEVVDVSRFFIPNQSSASLSKLGLVCIEVEYSLQDLYEIYKRLGGSSDWRRDVLGDFLVKSLNRWGVEDGVVVDMMGFQRFIQNNDSVGARFLHSSVRLVHLFQKEFEGGVSHYIFPRERIVDDFLFFVDRQYERMQDAIVVFTASPGEWTIHSNLGVGQKVFSGAQAVNMLDCSIVDMARMSATPILKTMGIGGRDISSVRFIPGVATDIGSAEFVQNQLGSNINQLVGASQYLTYGLDINAVNMGDDPALPDRHQGSVSAQQIKMRSYNEFGILKNNVAHFYNTFDLVIRNMFIRMLTSGKGSRGYEYYEEFRERCLEDGVPEELLSGYGRKRLSGLPKQFRQVRAVRVAGDGSTLARIMGLEALGQIAGTFNQREMAAFKREYVEATQGIDYVSVYAGSDRSVDEVSGGTSLAGLENLMMEEGKVVTFSVDNEHEAHVRKHLELVTGILERMRLQEVTPIDVTRVLDVAIPHMQEHIAVMERAPMFYRGILEEVKDVFGEIVRSAQLIKKNAQTMLQAAIREKQREAELQSEAMTEQERKDFVALREQERKDFVEMKKQERAMDAHESRKRLKEEEVRSEIERKNLLADVEVRGSVLDRARAALRLRSEEDLKAELVKMGGVSPSGIDFE